MTQIKKELGAFFDETRGVCFIDLGQMDRMD